MNIFDLILALPLGYCIWKGYKRGIIFETAALVGIIGGCWAAVRFARLVADFLGMEGEGTVLIAFFITFVGVVVLSFFLGKCIQGFVKLVKVGLLDKLLGAVLGMVKCICIISVILSLLDIVGQHTQIIKEESKNNSLLYRPIEKTGAKMIPSIISLKDYIQQEIKNKDK